MLTLNALVAADSVMVPMQCEYYALEGLSSLVQTIEQIRGSINPDLEIEGLLRTMFDPRNNLANEVSAQLIEHFGDKVFRTMIPRNVRLAEAPSFGKPALFHDKESRGALAYLALAGEMIRRDDVPPPAEMIGRDDVPPRPYNPPHRSLEFEHVRQKAVFGSWACGAEPLAGAPRRHAGVRTRRRSPATGWRTCPWICCSGASTSRASTCGPRP